MPEGLTVTDTEAKVSIKACLDNFTSRLLKDPHVTYSMKNLKKKHGDKVIFRLLYKCGYDGSTKKKSKVHKIFFSYYMYMYLSNLIGKIFLSSEQR